MIDPKLPAIPWGHVVVMVISWISFLIYINLILTIIVKKKKNTVLSSPVYCILVCNSIGDICMFFHVEFIMRPRKYRYFGLYTKDTPDWVAFYSHFVLSYLRSVMIFGYLILAANRFTAFATPFLYEKIWRTRNIITMTLLLWFFSLCLTIPMFIGLTTQCSFTILPNGVLQILAGDLVMRDAIQAAVISLSVCIFCVFLYIGGIFYAHKVQNHSAMERKLLICSCLYSIPLVIESCKAWYMVYGTLVKNEAIVFRVDELWFYWTEIMTSVQCWSILLITPSARRLLLEEGVLGFCFRRHNTVTVVVTITKPMQK